MHWRVYSTPVGRPPFSVALKSDIVVRKAGTAQSLPLPYLGRPYLKHPFFGNNGPPVVSFSRIYTFQHRLYVSTTPQEPKIAKMPPTVGDPLSGSPEQRKKWSPLVLGGIVAVVGFISYVIYTAINLDDDQIKYPDSAYPHVVRALALEQKGTPESLLQAVYAWQLAAKACLEAKLPPRSETVLTTMIRLSEACEKTGDLLRAYETLDRNVMMPLDSRYMEPHELWSETKEEREARWKRQFLTGVKMVDLMTRAQTPLGDSALTAYFLGEVCDGTWPYFYESEKEDEKPEEMISKKAEQLSAAWSESKPPAFKPPSWLTQQEISVAREAAGLLFVRIASLDPLAPHPERDPSLAVLMRAGYFRGIGLFRKALDDGLGPSMPANKDEFCRRAMIVNDIADAGWRYAVWKHNFLTAVAVKPGQIEPLSTAQRTDLPSTTVANIQEWNANIAVPGYQPRDATSSANIPIDGEKLRSLGYSAKDLQWLAPQAWKQDLQLSLEFANLAKKLAAEGAGNPLCDECASSASFSRALMLDKQGWTKQAVEEMKIAMALAQRTSNWKRLEIAGAAVQELESKLQVVET